MTPTNPTPRASGQDPRNALDRLHAQHGHADHDGLYNEDVAHEYTDVNIKTLLLFCLGLVAVVGVASFAMLGLFKLFEYQAAQKDPVASPLAIPAGQLPPEPRLVTDEPKNLLQVKTEERQVLDGYAWVDEKAGTARIPIDEAKKRLLHEGLPTRATPVEPWTGTYAPARGESSAGRMIPTRPGTGAAEPQPAQPAAAQPDHKPAAEATPHKGGL